MNGLRADKDRARRDLHLRAAIPALYIPAGGGDPLPVTVRVHKSVVKLGEEKDGVVRRDITPRIVFLRDDVALPQRGAVVSVTAGEAYQVGESFPPDGITISATVAQLPIAKTAGLPVPAAG